MVISSKQNTHKQHNYQGRNETGGSSAKINASTPYGLSQTRLTAFGGLLPLIKFLKIVNFEEMVSQHYTSPCRKTFLGCYKMLTGFLMLIFVGFQRINHFDYIRTDTMVCGFLDLVKLPAVSTFWRYLASLTYNQAKSILRLSATIRQRVWEEFHRCYECVHINIDTTVATVYGNTEGARKGHNSRHRGKKGLRPVLLFIEETREYLCGTQRRGETMSNSEVAKQIHMIGTLLPPTVQKIIVRGDGEFIGWESVKACMDNSFYFIFGNKRCDPPFAADAWYRKGDYEYNEVLYQPIGWEKACRFVAMRIPKDKKAHRQLEIFKDDEYLHRVFATNLSHRPHKAIKNYDKRADVENCIEEAQKEGILSIPSNRFLSNMVFFQIVMLAYNFWRWIKIGAQVHSENQKNVADGTAKNHKPLSDDVDALPSAQLQIADASLRIARLKMLCVSAKIVTHGNVTTIKYSSFDPRSYSLIDFLNFLDARLDKQSGAVASRYESTG